MTSMNRRILRHTPDVREDVVTDNERGGYPEPDQTFENVVHDEVAADRI